MGWNYLSIPKLQRWNLVEHSTEHRALVLLLWYHFDGLVEGCSIASALAMETLQPCTKPSTYIVPYVMLVSYYMYILNDVNDIGNCINACDIHNEITIWYISRDIGIQSQYCIEFMLSCLAFQHLYRLKVTFKWCWGTEEFDLLSYLVWTPIIQYMVFINSYTLALRFR